MTSLHGIGVGDDTDWDIYVEKCYGCLPGTTYGRAECRGRTINSNGTSDVCFHWHILYDGDRTDAFSAVGMRQAGCHETGHTVGLMHVADNSDDRTFGCIVTNVPVDGAGSREFLKEHNVAHINAAY